MKTLFILGLPSQLSTAAWTRIVFFAEAWANKTNQVDVLCTFTHRTLKERGVKLLGGIRIYSILPHMVSSIPPFFAVNALLSFAGTLLFLLAKKPDIAIISVPPGDAGLGAISACRLSRTKYVVDVRDLWEDYEINKSTQEIVTKGHMVIKELATRILQKSRLVVTVTSDFGKNLTHRGIKNVEIFPNGADINVFRFGDRKAARQKLGFGNDDFIFVYNGMIGDYYHFDVVLNALAKLGELRDKTQLVLVGSGPELPKIERITKKLGLEKNVHYLGVKQSRADLAEVLSAADVGLIPGLYSKGQLPVKLFEYSACELPTMVIAPEDSLLTKLVKEHDIGIIVPLFSEENVVDAIVQLYKNAEFRTAAGKRARALIEEKFDRNKISKEYLKVIKSYFDLSIDT